MFHSSLFSGRNAATTFSSGASIFANLLFVLGLCVWGESAFSQDRVVVIGDVHADANALYDALKGAQVLDGEGRFSARRTDVVLDGDLSAKGPNSQRVWSLVFQLQQEARRLDSRVHVNIGNHDWAVLHLDLSRMWAEDLAEFAKSDHRGRPKMGLVRAMAGRFGGFIQNWNIFYKSANGDVLAVHAGPSTTLL